MSERTFTEEEVATLFRRASELQAERRAGSDRSGFSERAGLTLDELSAIAAEAGLDPEHVRLAAAEMDRSAVVDQRGESGVRATEIFAERRVPKAVSEETVEDTVAELRHRYDTSAGACMGMPHYGRSTTQSIGRSVDWKHTNLSGIETRVLLQARDSGFRVRVSRRSEWGGVTNWTSFAAVIALLVGFLAAPTLGSYLLGLLVGLVTLLMAVPLMRGLNSRWIEKQRREVEELADSIADQALRSVQAEPVPTLSPSPHATELEVERGDDPSDADSQQSASASVPRRRTR